MVPMPVGSHGREHAAKDGDVVPQTMGTLQYVPVSPQAASLWSQKRRQVITEQPTAEKVKHCEPGAQSLLLAQVSPGDPPPDA
jgi:hypothetical protein